MKKVVIYGAGARGKRLCRIVKNTGIEVVAVLDTNSAKWGSYVEEHIVLPPEKIKDFTDVSVCISIEDWNIVQIIRNKFKDDIKNEILYEELIFEAYRDNKEIRKHLEEKHLSLKKKETIIFDCVMGLGLGGIEAWTINVCKELLKKEYDNVYILSKFGEYEVPSVLENKILYADIEVIDRFSEKSLINIIQVLKENLPCKIITSQVDEIMLASILLKEMYPDLIEIVSVIHNGDENTYEHYEAVDNSVNLFIGVSEEIQHEMLKRGIDESRVQFMTCPFACEKEIIRTYAEDKTMPIRIGYAGRMDKVGIMQKRMDLLLLFAKELEERNIHYIFELAGDGPARKEMEEFVRRNNLQEKVKFLGTIHRSEISAFWKRQDIFVNFADFEGRCISKLEAMANGAVPITTNTAGTKEDIEDGVNGFIVSLGDYESMIERVIYLENHRERLKEMGALAHERIYPKSKMKDHIAFWERVLKLK